VGGKYQINAPLGATIEFRFVGKKTREVTVGASNVYDVALEYDLVRFNEVVVTGYGTQIKSKVTGSIAKVDGDALRNIPVPTVEQALQGKTAGVFIESVNGESTGTTNMRIRGSSSITATNQPLFVVDGIPITTEALNKSGAVINPLTSINFNDVESIDILKDAASSAIYGSRGANGVWYDNQLTSQLASWKKPGDITDVPQARLGWDPEVSTDFLNDNITSGCDFYSAPQPRSIVFGINIGL
jgi:TonB-dependent SusC/RagA subfamily outer membrane receptor